MNWKFALVFILLIGTACRPKPVTADTQFEIEGRLQQSISFDVDAITEVQQWPTFIGMKEVFAPRGHGTIAGDYDQVTAIEPLDEQTAWRLLLLRRMLESKARQTTTPGDNQAHIGMRFPAGSTILRGTTSGSIANRTIANAGNNFDIDQPDNEQFFKAEISAVFYDPRADHMPKPGEQPFAVRLENVYCEQGHMPSMGCTAYVELSWKDMLTAAVNAFPYISSTSHMVYPPAKDHNMAVALQMVNKNMHRLSGSFEFTRLLGMWEYDPENPENTDYVSALPEYVDWQAMVDGEIAIWDASGVCANTSIMGLTLITGSIAHNLDLVRWSSPHWEDELVYYPNGTNSLAYELYPDEEAASGTRVIHDTSVATPGKLARYRLPNEVEVKMEAWLVHYPENPFQEPMIYVVGFELLADNRTIE
ncbi:MAG: hypothetical protein ACOCXQ_00670 [Patescibacteria group bacterium]